MRNFVGRIKGGMDEKTVWFGYICLMGYQVVTCISLTPPHEQEVTQGHFKEVFNMYNFRVFFLEDWF